MQDLTGRTAFITGGASGIGLAMAHAFGGAGMNIMLADIEEPPLRAAIAELQARQIPVAGLTCDVSDRASVEAAAAETVRAFGKVHVVCNNAGVVVGGRVGEVKPADWDWIFSVNVMGVIYGMEAFLPLIRSHGEGGCFVNSASMAGMISPAGREPYSATKFALVALSEGWGVQLEPEGIHVAILCPGFVKTGLSRSGRTRQARYGGPAVLPPPGARTAIPAIEPERVGERVLEAVRAGERYIFTHPDMRSLVQDRFARIMRAFDDADASAALAGLDYETPPIEGLGN
ncbi:MAG: SDR family NAD(P)-dependent oxidoreductase [Caulobacterales bacterium]|nr:SDR family NAD(P)-dependent oxidoreductase [Caulobacterales bacterium]